MSRRDNLVIFRVPHKYSGPEKEHYEKMQKSNNYTKECFDVFMLGIRTKVGIELHDIHDNKTLTIRLPKPLTNEELAWTNSFNTQKVLGSIIYNLIHYGSLNVAIPYGEQHKHDIPTHKPDQQKKKEADKDALDIINNLYFQ